MDSGNLTLLHLPQNLLRNYKNSTEKTSKDHMHVQFPAIGACFMWPWLPQPHQTESRDALFGSLASFFTLVMAGLSTPHPSDLILQPLHPLSPPNDLGWTVT